MKELDEPVTIGASDIRVMPFLIAFAAIALLMAGDLVGDYLAGSKHVHLALEAAAMVVSCWGAMTLGRTVLAHRRRLRRELSSVAREREVLAAEAARWKAEAQTLMTGLGEAIERQLERWSLTPAEAEVALLLLKGLSTKEIAEVRSTSDQTVRQQAKAIYTKSGLSGRAQLAAFFLEDLMLPAPRE